MKRAQISLVTFDLLAEKAQDEAISAVIAITAGASEKSRPSGTASHCKHFDQA